MIKIFVKFLKNFREFSVPILEKKNSEKFREFSRIFAKILEILKIKKFIFKKNFFFPKLAALAMNNACYRARILLV